MRRRALLAGAATCIAGCGGRGDGTPTATPRSGSTTDRPTMSATPTRPSTPTRTLSPATLRDVREALSSAVRRLDEQVRRRTLTGATRPFDPQPVQDRLAAARRALEGTAAAHLRAYADAVAATLAAARAYAALVGGVRAALSLHRARRFGDAAGRFGGLAAPLSTAVVDRSTAVDALATVPSEAIDAEAVGRARLAGTLAYLDDALAGIEAVVTGGTALESGVETFAAAERQFGSESYRSAARTYRDAGVSLADAVDGFATDRPRAAFPDHVRETLDAHRCRADAYRTAAGRMRVAAEQWRSDPPAAGGAYDAAREALASDCVVVEWPAPSA